MHADDSLRSWHTLYLDHKVGNEKQRRMDTLVLELATSLGEDRGFGHGQALVIHSPTTLS